MFQDKTSAYLVGVAVGDGNISNPNGRALRLRITCDKKYPKIIKEIQESLSEKFPKNKIGLIRRKDNCIDISCYSNKLSNIVIWSHKKGPKHVQKIEIPQWIKKNEEYSKECLRGLFQTDGSIYMDRGYKMVNFVTIIPTVAKDVFVMIKKLGFIVSKYKINTEKNTRYNIRISKNSEDFIKTIKLFKT